MIKFLMNLFNLRKVAAFKPEGNWETYKEDGCEISLNREKGQMVIKTDYTLSERDIKNILNKYL